MKLEIDDRFICYIFIEIVKYKVGVILQDTQRTEMVFDQASGKIISHEWKVKINNKRQCVSRLFA